MEQVLPRVHRIVSECDGLPFNVYLVDAGGLLLVDAGTALTTPEATLPALRELPGPPRLEFLAVTHAHADHCGGASGLQEAFPCIQIAATRETGRWMADHHDNVCYSYGALPSDWPLSEDVEREFLALLGAELCPTRLLKDGDSLDLGADDALQAIATPGHCPGHAVYYLLRSKVLFTGDALQGRGIPVGDPPRYLPVYDDVAAYTNSLRRLASQQFNWALPGHGDPLSPREFALLVQESLEACETIESAVRHLHERQPAWSVRSLTEAVSERLGYAEVDVTGGMTVRAHLQLRPDQALRG